MCFFWNEGLKNTVELSFNEESAIIHWYSVSKLIRQREFNMCPGDLYKICNVLWDYEGILKRMVEMFPEDLTSGQSIMWDVYRQQLSKIREKIEGELGYSVEKAHEKCMKKLEKQGKDDGIGEDAFVLAIRKGREEAEKKKKEKEKNEQDS